MTIVLDGSSLTVEKLVRIARDGERVELDPAALERIKTCRAMLEEKIAAREIMYGTNTGIGEFSEHLLSDEQVREFQRYLVYNHAAGIGAPAPIEHVRAAMAGRVNVHAHGNSACRPEITLTLVTVTSGTFAPVEFLTRLGVTLGAGDLDQALAGEQTFVGIEARSRLVDGRQFAGYLQAREISGHVLDVGVGHLTVIDGFDHGQVGPFAIPEQDQLVGDEGRGEAREPGVFALLATLPVFPVTAGANLVDIPAITQIHPVEGRFHGRQGAGGQQADREQGHQQPLSESWFLHLIHPVTHITRHGARPGIRAP